MQMMFKNRSAAELLVLSSVPPPIFICPSNCVSFLPLLNLFQSRSHQTLQITSSYSSEMDSLSSGTL